ncbi:MAG: GNAT family N-acetyltransferase [Verrucomicrobiota bacterium]
MSLESALERYPKDIKLKDGSKCTLRVLEPGDTKALNEFFIAMAHEDLLFLKHRMTDPAVVRKWCEHIDHGEDFVLLAVRDNQILGEITLHQQLGGWKRHIGDVTVHVHPSFRGKHLARTLIAEIIEIGRECGLERLETEFIGKQKGAMKMFGLFGFSELMRLNDYVKDMQATKHDYVLMGMRIVTDEEYAGMG